MHLIRPVNRQLTTRKFTEAFAGSDVGGLQTTAVRDGDEWVINGTKKCVLVLIIHYLDEMLTEADGSRMECLRTTSLWDARQM